MGSYYMGMCDIKDVTCAETMIFPKIRPLHGSYNTSHKHLGLHNHYTFYER